MVLASPHRILALGLLLGPLPGWADAFLTKNGTVGILDVPTADALGAGRAWGTLDLFAERAADGSWRVAPLPVAVGIGLPLGLDLGLALRISGLPGDPEPVLPLLSGTVKYSFLRSKGWRPALAAAATFDRINWRVESSLRALASTAMLGPVRLAAFAGVRIVELDPNTIAPIAGLAALARLPLKLEVFAEGLRAGDGWMFGTGVRWSPWKHLGFSASGTWKPGDLAPRIAISLAVFAGEPPSEEAEEEEATPPTQELEAAAAGQVKRPYADPRPRFRLKIRPSARESTGSRHLQYEAEPPPEDAEESPAPEKTP